MVFTTGISFGLMNQRFYGKYKKREELGKTEDGFTCCRWCKKAVTPPRRTICSEECAHELKIRTSGRYLRRCVYKRDKGLCSVCNQDTKLISQKALSIENIDARNIYLKENEIPLKRKIWKRKNGGGLWDADHIIPVKDGGGLCGIDNIRTLCIPCHKKKTYAKNEYNIESLNSNKITEL